MLTSDHDPALAKRLARIETGVDALTAAMALVIDTLQQQTNLLAGLSEAAIGTPDASPVVAAINTLSSAVVSMGAGIDSLRVEMEALPDRLAAALAEEGVGSSPGVNGLQAP